jgi:hypothetical protein
MREGATQRRALLVTVVVALLAFAAAPAVADAAARFQAGAATRSFTPPRPGGSDPADCVSPANALFSGPRAFSFEEPYVDQQSTGHYDLGDPYVDCNHDGRWDGNFVGGGSDAPRYYDQVADEVGARALVISNGSRTVAIEVVDQEGLFNVYADRIRERVKADGYRAIDSMQISATHDESAPDSLGLGGPSPATSGTNAYFVDYLVSQSAKAIEAAYDARRAATIRYAQAREPANLRQCWSSYPYIDDQLMPVMQAVATNGSVIATLASVSQHAETLGFNGGDQADGGVTLDTEKKWLSSDWPHFFRTALEQRYGGVGIEMAGAVGSVETPQVFSQAVPRTPQQYVDASHPAGCRTLFQGAGAQTPLGYHQETAQLGQVLAGAVEGALASGAGASRSDAIWADTRDVCVQIDNALFKAAALGGVFAERPAYLPGCKVQVPVAPTGQTAGTSIKTQVAAWRIGDAEFIGLPGEVFPFTYFRGPVGPQDMNYPQYAMPPWPLPYMHAPYRFFDGLDNDMVGYVFPQGNDAGVPGDHPTENPTADGTDRFGCGHSDDSEAASAAAADDLGKALVSVLGAHGGKPEAVERGRYVLPDGKLSRNPEGTTDTVKCSGPDTTFKADGPATAVWEPGRGQIVPKRWMDLSGRPQARPDRNTRGYIGRRGKRHWLDVFPDVSG